MPAIRIINRDAYPEILSISQRVDGVQYSIKVPDAKNRLGYDLVTVLVSPSGMTHTKSASRSRITGDGALKIVKKYVRDTQGLQGTASRTRTGRHSMVPPSWSLGSSDNEHEQALRQDTRDGHRLLLKAAAQARRGECGRAVESLAIGANRIGSAMSHGAGLRPWPEPQQSLIRAQKTAVAEVARFCKLAPGGLDGTPRRRRRRR